jgi:hypothetical protein
MISIVHYVKHNKTSYLQVKINSNICSVIKSRNGFFTADPWRFLSLPRLSYGCTDSHATWEKKDYEIPLPATEWVFNPR